MLSRLCQNGSANLYFFDPDTLQQTRITTVHDFQGQVSRLNALDYVKESIYANVWTKETLAIIDPGEGVVTDWLDLGGLSARW